MFVRRHTGAGNQTWSSRRAASALKCWVIALAWHIFVFDASNKQLWLARLFRSRPSAHEKVLHAYFLRAACDAGDLWGGGHGQMGGKGNIFWVSVSWLAWRTSWELSQLTSYGWRGEREGQLRSSTEAEQREERTSQWGAALLLRASQRPPAANSSDLRRFSSSVRGQPAHSLLGQFGVCNIETRESVWK